MKKLARILKDESGQGATEYILLVAVVVALVVMFQDKIKGLLGKSLDKVEGGIDKIND